MEYLGRLKKGEKEKSPARSDAGIAVAISTSKSVFNPIFSLCISKCHQARCGCLPLQACWEKQMNYTDITTGFLLNFWYLFRFWKSSAFSEQRENITSLGMPMAAYTSFLSVPTRICPVRVGIDLCRETCRSAWTVQVSSTFLKPRLFSLLWLSLKLLFF